MGRVGSLELADVNYYIQNEETRSYCTAQGYSVVNNNGKEYEKEYIYNICITESLCYTAEMNTTL